MSGWFFIGFGLAMTLVDFFVGRHLAEMDAGRLKPRPDGSTPQIEPVNRLGRILMLVSPIFFIVLAALGFGAIPVAGIEPVSFN